MIDLPRADVIGYLIRFRVSAIYALTAPGKDKPVVLAVATDIGRSMAVQARHYAALFAGEPPDVPWAAWVDSAAAGRICEAVTHRPRGGVVNADLQTVIGMVTGTARRYGLRMSDHAATMDRAGGSVTKIAAKVEGSRSNGALSAFNEAYKQRRIIAQRQGKYFVSYGIALHRLNRAVAAAAATGGASSPISLLHEVFGD